MILVAGLAVAGLAGIAAAFYFSMRPGGSRVRAAGASRAGAGRGGPSRSPAGRSRTSQLSSDRPDRAADLVRSAGPSRPAGPPGSGSGRASHRTGPSTVIDFTGPQRVLEDPEPRATGRRPRHGDRPDAAVDEPGPGHRAAARRVPEADTEDAAQAAKSRRRVGWRKGSDVDEEMWPVEGFGGVSDEQFWDDLAADKPLATTARTAQPEAAARRRPGPLPDLRPADGRVPGDSAGGRGGGRGAAAEGPGTHPQPRLGPDDRTAIHPAQAAAPPPPTATQPVRAVHQPTESRGRSRADLGADEDPLTSPAYSLRPKGRVDGRSYPSSRPTRDPSGEQYRPPHGPNGQGRPDPLRPDPLRPDPLRPADPYTAYPYSQQSFGETTQSMSTPPYGESYGPGNPAGSRAQAGSAGDPRRANGGWSPDQAGGPGAGDGNWGSRPAYPPVNGHRGPYDPQGYDRRLSSAF
jgi:hypothetical protein